MSNVMDAKHWWDGWVYAIIVDPMEKEIRDMISNYIDDNSSMIDLGCATGILEFELAGRCKKLVGVDITPRM